ncbi:MAG: hypothetical protein ACI4VX_01915 [Succinivibrionaceae bacterium]
MYKDNFHEEKMNRVYVFLLSLILLVFLVGYAAHKMMPGFDDATTVSLDTLKVSFAEGVQMVHTYWINNGKQSRQFLDMTDDSRQKIRVSFMVGKSGWPQDSKFVDGMKNTGKTPCERLWEGIFLKNAFRQEGLIKLVVSSTGSSCRYRIGKDALDYSFLNGSVTLSQVQ